MPSLSSAAICCSTASQALRPCVLYLCGTSHGKYPFRVGSIVKIVFVYLCDDTLYDLWDKSRFNLVVWTSCSCDYTFGHRVEYSQVVVLAIPWRFMNNSDCF
jgi:hypothetical protein